MLLSHVQFHNAGYCFQNEYFTGTGTYHWRKFQAVFVSFEHPVHGRCLIDTGYGPAFLEATRKLPGWIMRHLLYTPSRQPVFSEGYLQQLEIDTAQISHVFISHFHADHIGGLCVQGKNRFPNARLVHRVQPLQWLKTLNPWVQLDQGFLPQLLPDRFSQDGRAIEESAFTDNSAVTSLFRTLDFWNDGSLILMDLPGHAIGHTGYLLNTDQGPIGYVVDAFWDSRTFDQNRRLPWAARRVQHNLSDYESTQEKLRQFRQMTGIPLSACHCKTTQRYVLDSN
jgi:glyoxylase-like metal-dependent hydrolase (beta-lactamase superfamily II)